MYKKEKRILLFILAFLLIYYILQKYNKINQVDNSIILIIFLILINLFRSSYVKTNENFKNPNHLKLIKKIELFEEESEETEETEESEETKEETELQKKLRKDNNINIKQIELEKPENDNLNENGLNSTWNGFQHEDKIIKEYEKGLKNVSDKQLYDEMLNYKKNSLSNPDNSYKNFDVFNIFTKSEKLTDALIASTFSHIKNMDDLDEDVDKIYSKINNFNLETSDQIKSENKNNEELVEDDLVEKINNKSNNSGSIYTPTLFDMKKISEDTEKNIDEKENDSDDKEEEEDGILNKFVNFINNLF